MLTRMSTMFTIRSPGYQSIDQLKNLSMFFSLSLRFDDDNGDEDEKKRKINSIRCVKRRFDEFLYVYDFL